MLKVNSTPNFIISLDYDLDWKTETFGFTVSYWDKGGKDREGKHEKFHFPGDGFRAACEKFRELEALHQACVQG